jgi:hypothetical protein
MRISARATLSAEPECIVLIDNQCDFGSKEVLEFEGARDRLNGQNSSDEPLREGWKMRGTIRVGYL